MKAYKPEQEKTNRVPCILVQDLLPLYIEELTSAESDQLLQDHLASCADCRARESLLRSEADAALRKQKQEDDAELNYLKKIRRSGSRKLMAAIAAMLVLLIAVCGTAVKLYGTGTDTDYIVDIFKVDYVPDSVIDYIVYVKGHVPDRIYCGYRLVTDSEGNDNLKIIARRPLPWESEEDIEEKSAFNLVINTADVKGSLTTPEYSVGPNGLVIQQLAKDLYKARHEYIGDAPANQSLAELAIRTFTYEPFESELETDQEPYIWTLHFTEPIQDENTLEDFELCMQQRACWLLALVENLDEVHWTYIEKTKNGTVEHTGSMNIEEACFYVGADYIKDYADSVYDVQLLLNRSQNTFFDRFDQLHASE